MFKPKIFIGSAAETIDLAHDIQQTLDHFAEITVWDQDVFFPSKSAMDSLQLMRMKVDFAIFVFTPTDTVKLRDHTSSVARDNVILELGLFAGYLGIERCFIVCPRGIKDFHFPTDLLGLIPCEYDANRTDRNMIAALGPLCNVIKKNISLIGLNIHKEVFSIQENIAKSFPTFTTSQTLAGYWLSRFEYTAYRQGKMITGVQYDIESLTAVNDYCLIGSNVCAIVKSGKIYLHQLKIQLVNNYLLGHWYNINTKNIGAFQLYIHTHHVIMNGCHLGNANNNSIQSGNWTWIKLDISGHTLADDDLKMAIMKRTSVLDRNFSKWINNNVAVPLNEVLVSVVKL
jgi:hypothetical protein